MSTFYCTKSFDETVRIVSSFLDAKNLKYTCSLDQGYYLIESERIHMEIVVANNAVKFRRLHGEILYGAEIYAGIYESLIHPQPDNCANDCENSNDCENCNFDELIGEQ